jgi:hypothetical protein
MPARSHAVARGQTVDVFQSRMQSIADRLAAHVLPAIAFCGAFPAEASECNSSISSAPATTGRNSFTITHWVVPGGRAARGLEDLRLGFTVLPEPVDQQVVEPEHGQVELGDEQVHVVARVTDQCDPWELRGTSPGSPRSFVPSSSLAGSSRSYRKGQPVGPSP